MSDFFRPIANKIILNSTKPAENQQKTGIRTAELSKRLNINQKTEKLSLFLHMSIFCSKFAVAFGSLTHSEGPDKNAKH